MSGGFSAQLMSSSAGAGNKVFCPAAFEGNVPVVGKWKPARVFGNTLSIPTFMPESEKATVRVEKKKLDTLIEQHFQRTDPSFKMPMLSSVSKTKDYYLKASFEKFAALHPIKPTPGGYSISQENYKTLKSLMEAVGVAPNLGAEINENTKPIIIPEKHIKDFFTFDPQKKAVSPARLQTRMGLGLQTHVKDQLVRHYLASLVDTTNSTSLKTAISEAVKELNIADMGDTCTVALGQEFHEVLEFFCQATTKVTPWRH